MCIRYTTSRASCDSAYTGYRMLDPEPLPGFLIRFCREADENIMQL